MNKININKILYTIFGVILLLLSYIVLFIARFFIRDYYSYRLFYQKVARNLTKIFYNVKYEKEYNSLEESDKGRIYICNHSSNLDFILVSNIRNVFYELAAKEIYDDYFFLRLVLKQSKCIIVDLNDKESKEKIIDKCVDRIDKGDSILIFPEGGLIKLDDDWNMNKIPILGEFKKGAFEIALRTGAQIHPVLLVNAYKTSPVYENNNRFMNGIDEDLLIKELPPSYADQTKTSIELAEDYQNMMQEEWNEYNITTI